MKDKNNREIDYLRVSVTDRCNLRCIYCMPEQGIKKKFHNDIMRFEEILGVIRTANSLGIKKVRFTGGEPLILSGIDKLIYETSKLEGIEDLSITTNGILLNDMVEDLKAAGLRRVNISLDTLDRNKYRKITRVGELNNVLSAIDKCIVKGLTPVKINVVLIKGLNDNEVDDFIKLTRDMPVEIRFIELMPIGEGIKLYEEGAISLEEVRELHPELISIPDKKGSTAKLFKLEGGKGKVGFISPISCKFCSDCNKIRLTAAGTVKPCLHSIEDISIKEFVSDEIALKKALSEVILNKPLEHHLEVEKRSNCTKMMYHIGG